MTATSTVAAGDGEHPAAVGTAMTHAPRHGDAPEHESGDGFGLTFAWEHGPHGSDLGERGRTFRFPAADDPGPGPRRLLAMSLYTALLGLLALAVTLRGLLVIAGGQAPGWYQPAFVAAGLAGAAFVVAAFLSIHRRRLPWLLLACAAAPLAVNVAVTVTAAA
jgi:hypothetical protein